MQDDVARPTGKPLYSIQAVAIGTLLGSLAAGAVMLWLNYRNLGHPSLANRVAGIGVLVYVLIVGLAALLPNNLVLGTAFIALQTGVAYWTAGALQGRAIAYHRQQGGAMHSNLRGALVGFLTGMAVIFVMLLLSALMSTLTG